MTYLLVSSQGVALVQPGRAFADDTFSLYQKPKDRWGAVQESRPQSFAERFAKAHPDQASWIDTTTATLDTAQKAFIIESQFRNADPIKRGATIFKLNYNEQLKEKAPQISDAARARYVELGGQAWEEAARRGKTMGFRDSVGEELKSLTDGATKLFSVGTKGDKTSAKTGLDIFLKMNMDRSDQERKRGRPRLMVAQEEGVPGSFIDPNPFNYGSPNATQIAHWVEKSKKDPKFDEEFTKIAPWTNAGKSLRNTPAKDIFASDPRAKHEFEEMKEKLGIKTDIKELQAGLANQKTFSKSVDKALSDLNTHAAKMKEDLSFLRTRAENEDRVAKEIAKKQAIESEKEDKIAEIDSYIQGPIVAANFLAVFVKDPDANRALRVGAMGLAAVGVATKALKGLINPLTALSSLGDIFGGIFSLFAGPSVDEQILQELKDVKALMKEMYANMQAQFGYLHAEIQKMHEALDLQLRHIENRLRMQLALARRIGNESSAGVVNVHKSVRDHADKQRYSRYEADLTDFRTKTKAFQLPSGKKGIKDEKFYDLYRECADFCTDGCTKPTMNGDPALGLPGFERPEFYSVLSESMSRHWNTAEVMRPFSQACAAAGSPLCDASGNLPNYLCWMIASQSLIAGQEAHPAFYNDIHVKSHREAGRDIPDYSHSQFRDALSQGRKLQNATQALAWKRTDGIVSLNRDHLRKLVDGHVSQLAAVEAHIKGRQTEMIPTLQKVIGFTEAMKTGKDITIPDELSVCVDQTKDVTEDKDRPVLKLSDKQKQGLRNLIPTDARILQMLEGGEMTFCIDHAVKWEDDKEGHCRTYSDFQLECPWSSRPVLNIKATAHVRSNHYPILNVTLKNPERIHRGNIYYRGGKGNERDPQENSVGWTGLMTAAWNSGSLSSALEKGTPSAYLAFHNVESILNNSQELSRLLENTIAKERHAYLDQLTQDYSADMTAKAFTLMDRVDASKQLIDRSLEIGFSPLREGSPYVSRAFSKVGGTAQLAGEIAENAHRLTTDESITEYFNQKKQQVRALLPAVEYSLREHEQESLENFASRFPPDADRDRLVANYVSHYTRESQVGRIGRYKSIEGMIETLENKLISLDRDAARQEIVAQHLALEKDISPRAVWGEPQTLSNTVPQCIESDSKPAEPIQLSDSEMRHLTSVLKRASKPEDWIGNRIGANRVRYCWKTVTGSIPRSFEIFAAYGTGEVDANPMTRWKAEFQFSEKQSKDGNVRIHIAGMRRKLPDSKDIKMGDGDYSGALASLLTKSDSGPKLTPIEADRLERLKFVPNKQTVADVAQMLEISRNYYSDAQGAAKTVDQIKEAEKIAFLQSWKLLAASPNNEMAQEVLKQWQMDKNDSIRLRAKQRQDLSAEVQKWKTAVDESRKRGEEAQSIRKTIESQRRELFNNGDVHVTYAAGLERYLTAEKEALQKGLDIAEAALKRARERISPLEEAAVKFTPFDVSLQWHESYEANWLTFHDKQIKLAAVSKPEEITSANADVMNKLDTHRNRIHVYLENNRRPRISSADLR